MLVINKTTIRVYHKILSKVKEKYGREKRKRLFFGIRHDTK